MSSTTCEHSDELLALGAMRLLSAAEQTRLDEQVRACAACQSRLQEYRALAALMPQLALVETAPAAALNGKAASSPNGKLPQPSAPLQAEPEASDFSGPAQPIAIGAQPRRASHRLVKVLSGLAAAVMLAGLIGGFWLLLLSRTSQPRNSTIAQPTQQTVITYNPCNNEVAKGVAVGGVPACGLVVMDYTQTPAELEEIDPTTGNPLAGLKPLQVGNALLAALSADRRTLALGIASDSNGASGYLQMVALDTWTLGAKLQIPLKEAEGLQDLAITPDATGIYVVIDDYTTPPKGTLQYYTYDRGHNTLAFRWSAPLPFAPGDGMINDGSFALSADGKTAYLFSAATNPPQLAAIPLKTNGIGSPRILPLPSIATGAEPPISDEHYTYKPGDPIYQWYQPAVMFEPAQNKLYLVHAEASDPGKDVLVVIKLSGTQMQILGPDIPITGENLPQADRQAPAQVGAAVGSRPLTLQPQRGLQPYKADKGVPYNGRNEVGTVSPDGRWLYLSGSGFAPQFKSDGSWNGEQETNMGLLKIDAQTGQVVGQWYKGAAFSGLTFGQDGRNLYLFGPPPGADTAHYSYPDELQVFDTQQNKLVGDFSNIEAGWFILPMP